MKIPSDNHTAACMHFDSKYKFRDFQFLLQIDNSFLIVTNVAIQVKKEMCWI